LRVDGPAMLGGEATTNLYRMDSTVDGNPIGWTIRTLETKLPKMLGRAGYPEIAGIIDMAAGTGGFAGGRRLAPGIARDEAQHRQAQPRHPYLRGRQHPVRARNATAADGRWRTRDPCAGRHRRDAGQEVHGRDRAPGLRPLLERRALSLWPAQQEPSHLLGSDAGRGSARVDAGAVREGQAPRDDRARRVSGRGGGSRRREDRLGASGGEGAGPRYVGGGA